jgi:FkbM family methyltransferase
MKQIVKKISILLTGMLPAKYRISYVNSIFYQQLICTIDQLNDGLSKDVVVYDIGAHTGAWTKQLKSEFTNVKYFMFEANQIHENDLKKIGCWYNIGILSDSEKVVDFYACGGTGDSLYREATDVYKNVKPIKAKCYSLDKLVEEKKIPFPDFIKVDTQGSELDVLKGASKCLSHAKSILLECPIYQYNLEAPSMKDYIGFMIEKGFYPSQCTEIHNMHGVFAQVDIIFMHENILDKMDSQFSNFFKRHRK